MLGTTPLTNIDGHAGEAYFPTGQRAEEKQHPQSPKPQVQGAVLLAFAVLILGAQERDTLDWKALRRGEVLVESAEAAGGTKGLRAFFLIDAPREAIWEAITNLDRFTQIFDGVERVRVIRETDAGVDAEFWIDAVLKKLHYVLHREYERPLHKLSWHRVSGDLVLINGSWTIETAPDDTRMLVIYESYVDVGAPVVSEVTRLLAKSRAKDMGKRLRQWVESQPR